MAEQCTGRGARGVVCAAAPLAASAGADGAARRRQRLRRGGRRGAGRDRAAAVEVRARRRPRRDQPSRRRRRARGAARDRRRARRPGRGRGVGYVARRRAALGRPAGRARRIRRARPPRQPAARTPRGPRRSSSAETGFPWAAVNERLSHMAAALVAEMHPDGCRVLPRRLADPRRRRSSRLPGLAAALRGARRARRTRSSTARSATRSSTPSESRGGVLTRADFAFARAEWSPCATGRAGDLAGVGDAGADARPVAARRERGDRRPVRSQADVYRATLAAIAARRATLADPTGTSMVSAVDADGNAVVVVHSNSYPRFGSGIVVPGYDLCLAEPGRPRVHRRGRPPQLPRRRPPPRDHAARVGGRRRLGRGAVPRRHAGRREPDAVEHPDARPDRRRLRRAGPARDVAPVGVAAGGRRRPHRARLRRRRRRARCDRPRRERPTIHRWGLKSAQQVVRLARPGEAVVGAADPRTVGAAVAV